MNNNKKYELIDDPSGLYRIRALRKFGMVDIGDIGGVVDFEHNLSHEGDCWIYNNAKVLGNAKVVDNATIGGHAQIIGHGRVFGNAMVYENATVCGDASVSGWGRVRGHARLGNNDRIISGVLNAEADGFATAQDSRYYTFLVAWKNEEIVSVTAGCREWTSMKEARNHFKKNYQSNGDVKECITILKHLENMFLTRT